MNSLFYFIFKNNHSHTCIYQYYSLSLYYEIGATDGGGVLIISEWKSRLQPASYSINHYG